MPICIKQRLSNIWSWTHEKVKQHWDWVKKTIAYKKVCICYLLMGGGSCFYVNFITHCHSEFCIDMNGDNPFFLGTILALPKCVVWCNMFSGVFGNVLNVMIITFLCIKLQKILHIVCFEIRVLLKAQRQIDIDSWLKN